MTSIGLGAGRMTRPAPAGVLDAHRWAVAHHHRLRAAVAIAAWVALMATPVVVPAFAGNPATAHHGAPAITRTAIP